MRLTFFSLFLGNELVFILDICHYVVPARDADVFVAGDVQQLRLEGVVVFQRQTLPMCVSGCSCIVFLNKSYAVVVCYNASRYTDAVYNFPCMLVDYSVSHMGMPCECRYGYCTEVRW